VLKVFEFLLPYLGYVLDIGNVVFFIANFPQLISTIRNRKNPEALKGLSEITMLGYMITTIFFITAGIITNGYLTVILGITNEIIFGLQVLWKKKYKERIGK